MHCTVLNLLAYIQDNYSHKKKRRGKVKGEFEFETSPIIYNNSKLKETGLLLQRNQAQPWGDSKNKIKI